MELTRFHKPQKCEVCHGSISLFEIAAERVPIDILIHNQSLSMPGRHAILSTRLVLLFVHKYDYPVCIVSHMNVYLPGD